MMAAKRDFTPKQALRRYFKIFIPRRVQTEATIVGVAAVLSLTLTWGLLEMFVITLPRIPLFYVFPFYFVVQGLASWRLSRKYGAGFCLP